MPQTYDVVIVGAGPAGLSAALMLGRCRRSVLVCDTGNPRNAASHALHGYLTRDGIDPERVSRDRPPRARTVRHGRAAQRRRDGRQVPLRRAIRRHARRPPDRQVPQAPDRHRRLRQPPGDRRDPRVVRAERLSLPLLRRLGSSRSADRDLRPRRPRARAVSGADDVEPGPRPLHRRAVRDRRRRARASRAQRRHAARGPHRRAARTRRDPRAHRLPDGEELARRALFFTTGQSQRSKLAMDLGCEINEKGTVRTGKYEATHLPGLFVAGRRVARGAVGDRRRRGGGGSGVCHQHGSHEGRSSVGLRWRPASAGPLIGPLVPRLDWSSVTPSSQNSPQFDRRPGCQPMIGHLSRASAGGDCGAGGRRDSSDRAAVLA